MGEEGKTKQKRLEFVVRQAWIIKIKRELDQILASMEDPSDQATRDQIEEWLSRSLRDVPVDEREIGRAHV